jgi:hypothetical protein
MTELDLQEQIARIARAQAETDKFAAEQRKVTSEGMKFERERTTMLLTAGAAFGGTAAVIGGLALKLFGR